MSTIDFVVRDSAGNIQRGEFGGVDGATGMMVGVGQDISINLNRFQILNYERIGNSLNIVLIDGSVITLENFFVSGLSAPNDLYVSADGLLTKVDLIETDTGLVADYGTTQAMGKSSPDDSLYFVDGAEVMVAEAAVADGESAMLGAAVLGGLGGVGGVGAGAAALAGGALLLGGGGNGGGGGGNGGGAADTTPPSVDVSEGVESVDHVVNGDDYDDGIEIGGTGEPGATIEVVVDGETETTVVGDDGSWDVIFDPGQLPDGEYETEVSVTATNDAGNSTTVTDVLIVDTEAQLTFETSTVEGEGVINAVENSDGVTFNGTTEIGSTVVVTAGGVSLNATVGSDGSWTVDFPSTTFAGGEYTADVVAVATDTHGNSTEIAQTVEIDTISEVAHSAVTIAGDGVINALEIASGVTFTGTTQPGSTVVVQAGGVSKTATVDANGNWSVVYGAGEMPAGEYSMDIVAQATDAAGNTSSATKSVMVDTVTDVTIATSTVEIDGVVNAAEAADDIVITGSSQPFASVVVTMGSFSRTVVSNAAGEWSANFAANEIASGEYTQTVTAVATDGAGNSASTSGSIEIDTFVRNFTETNGDIAGDDIVNQAENATGLSLTGTTEAGSTVIVELAGITKTAVVDGAGNWSVSFAPNEIPSGEYDTSMVVTATDSVGNVSTLSEAVRVDTFVNELSLISDPTGADDVFNADEAAAGVTLTGTVEAGSTVVVTLGGVTRQATVDASGNWSVDFTAAEVPQGETSVTAVVNATDAAGNTDTSSQTYAIDTVAPDAPDIESYVRGTEGVRGVGVDVSEGQVTVSEIAANGTATQIGDNSNSFVNPLHNELTFGFDDPVPDGSHLVVTSEDAVGNDSSTYFVLDEIGTSVVDLPSSLDGFNIEQIDLQFAEDAELTLTSGDLEDLSNHTNTLIVNGGSDDTINIAGATATNQSTSIDGQTYDIYTLGSDGGTLIINDDINVVI